MQLATRLSRDQLAGRASRVSRHRFLTIAAVVPVAAGFLAAESQRPLMASAPELLAMNSLVTAAFALVAVLLDDLRPGPGYRTLPVVWGACGLLWPASWLGWWGSEPAERVGYYAPSVFWVLLGAAVLLYTRQRLGRGFWAYLVLGGIDLVGGKWVLATFGSPSDLTTALFVADLAVGGLFLWLLGRSLRTAPRSERLMLTAAVSPAALVLAVALTHARTTPYSVVPTTGALLVVQDLTLLLLAGAIVAATVRLRLFQVSVAEHVASLPWPITGEAVQATLRRLLGDPGLEIYYWLPSVGGYVDAGGAEAPGPIERDDRLVVDVADPANEPIVVLRADPGRVKYRNQFPTTVSMIGPALESARLQAVSNAHSVQSRALKAGWAERRELEQLLHDGAQTRLSALTMRLGAARSQETDEETGKVLADAQAELGRALRELRELADGIHSTMLTESGLGSALDAAATRYAIPVRVVAPAERFAPNAEALAYYVVVWVLTALIRRPVGVVDVVAELNQIGDHLSVRVHGQRDSDDALTAHARRIRAAPRPRLRELTEPPPTVEEALESPIALRVRAAGGSLSMSESPDRQITVQASIPCL